MIVHILFKLTCKPTIIFTIFNLSPPPPLSFVDKLRPKFIMCMKLTPAREGKALPHPVQGVRGQQRVQARRLQRGLRGPRRLLLVRTEVGLAQESILRKFASAEKFLDKLISFKNGQNVVPKTVYLCIFI
jgi:hypothetical protein